MPTFVSLNDSSLDLFVCLSVSLSLPPLYQQPLPLPSPMLVYHEVKLTEVDGVN